MIHASLSPVRARFLAVANTLSARLFFWLFGVVLVVVAGNAYFTIRTTSQRWMDFVYESASRMSELIHHSLHNGMLQNRKDDVHQIIRTMAQTSGVAGVRILDKQGVIIFSADLSELGQHVDLQAETCVVCHDRSTPLRSAPTESRSRVFRTPNGERILALIKPIENEPACSNAACHAHPKNKTVLGVLDVKMSMATADAALDDMTRRTIVATLLKALIIGIASALFIYRMVRRPVSQLIEGTQQIAHGDLQTHIDVRSKNEIGQLASSFNQMTEDLRRARQEVTEWSQKLEQKVVAKTEELGCAQKQIVHMEKMASLGKLAATVAHELNNPLSGILTYAKLVSRDLERGTSPPEQKDELTRYLTLIQKEAARCGDIVRNLLVFSRQSGGQFVAQQLGPIIERALMLVRHHLEMSSTQLQASLPGENDCLVCDGNQLQQALIALFVNAVEAMPEGGCLKVRAWQSQDAARIEVGDTGVGIPPEVLPHIFEPFFSTKEGASGVGLGLAVVYGIVHRHGGTIEVSSEPGQGTTFRLKFPLRPDSAAVETTLQPAATAPADGRR